MPINTIIVTGNLGNDGEQRFTPSGDSIVTFSVPASSGFGDKKKTAWLRCTLFGKRGESVLPYLKKGQLVGVQGEFSLDEWTGKDGDKRVTACVRVTDVTLLGKAQESQQEAPQQARRAPAKAQGKAPAFAGDDDDLIPF